jgi:uroporphyrinogen decarboxylase
MAGSVIDPSWPKLTHRDRFRRLMHFQTVDRGVHWEFGYLEETMSRWHEEGLPEEIHGNGPVEAYFGVDPTAGVPVSLGLVPPFTGETEVLEETEGRRVVRQPDGTVLEEQTKGRHTIPHYIKFPIAGREDWARWKERLDPADPKRFETDWEKVGRELAGTDKPVGIGIGSFLGWPRNWIGFENLALMCYDDPGLVREIVGTLGEVIYRQLEAALRHCEVDYASGWEDICFRNGPMVSPAMFEEMVIPHVRRVCGLLGEHGVTVIWTDCDGDIRPLVSLWLEAGLNCMFPLEVAPGSDPVALRKEYGHQILLRGGLEKYRMAKGRKEILAELKRVEPVVADGGYIPHADHRVPDDVPYENYRYYVREKLAMLGWPKEEIAAVAGLRGLKG